jgi:hypothetical protein
MSMRRWIHALAIAALGACGLEREVPDQAALTQAVSGPPLPLDDLDVNAYLILPRCPESSTNCTGTNGPGIYAEEGGRAGIDTTAPPASHPYALLITSFLGDGSQVMFRARYLNESSPSPPAWQWVTGTVDSADVDGAPGFRVLGVDEVRTAARWTLVAPSGHMFDLVDRDLGRMRLHLSFFGEKGPPTRLVFYFTDATFAAGRSTRIADVQSYKMRWRDESEGRTDAPPLEATPYCLDASGHADRVVFQRAIVVDPITGKVVHDASSSVVDVTISCTRGAIATAYRWGYPYAAGAADPFYFAAAIQMKRAAYCADDSTYTTAGTEIAIRDNLGIQSDTIEHLEAWWSTAGAVCVNQINRRHASLNRGTCVGGHNKPPCPPGLPGGRYLVNGASPPAP